MVESSAEPSEPAPDSGSETSTDTTSEPGTSSTDPLTEATFVELAGELSVQLDALFWLGAFTLGMLCFLAVLGLRRG